MEPETVLDLFRFTLVTVIVMISVIIVPGLLVGLVVSIFQAATQINEQTLSFVPRLLVTIGSLIFFGPWLLDQILNFTKLLVTSIPQYLL